MVLKPPAFSGVGVTLEKSDISTPERSLGLLEDRAGCIIHDDFEISEKEMLAS